MALEIEQRRGLYGFDQRDVDRRRVDNVEERKTFDIKQLWQRSHEMVDLALRGFKHVEIARILNMHPMTVSNTLNSQLGMHKLSELRQNRDEESKVVGEKIRVLTERALNIYDEILNSELTDFDIKKKVADTVVLELSGLRVPTKVQSHHVSTTLTKDEIEEFKQRGIKAAKESGMIVEVPENVKTEP